MHRIGWHGNVDFATNITSFGFLITQRPISKIQRLKISEKVSFNIASEASYIYTFSGQKFIKNAKHGLIWQVFENLNFLSNSDTRQVTFINAKIGEKHQNSKIQMRHFE